jgi:hypothetical protein
LLILTVKKCRIPDISGTSFLAPSTRLGRAGEERLVGAEEGRTEEGWPEHAVGQVSIQGQKDINTDQV